MDDAVAMTTAVLEMHKRCRARRTEAEEDALIAENEAKREEYEAATWRARQEEQARSSDAWWAKRIENALARLDQALADGLVEIRVDPGAPWSRDWLDDVLSYRVPRLNPEVLDRSLGCMALLWAAGAYETRLEQGRPVKNPPAYVTLLAKKVMAGRITAWVTEDEAAACPDLIVGEFSESYFGRLWACYRERTIRLRGHAAWEKEAERLGMEPL